jgi:hypothetical protein
MRTKKIDILSYSTYIVLAIILIVFAIGGNNFLTLKSIYATINNGSPLIIITCGVTFCPSGRRHRPFGRRHRLCGRRRGRPPDEQTGYAGGARLSYAALRWACSSAG